MKPCLQERIQARQQKQKEVHDRQTREVIPRGRVYTKNYRRAGLKWLPGKIVSVPGPVSAIVELTDRTKVRKHFDQIRKCEAEIVESPGDEQSFELETESCTDVGDNVGDDVDNPTLPAEAPELEDNPGSV